MYIYIDEAGILTKGQGNYFIIASFVTSDKLAAGRCMKKIRQNFLKKQYKQSAELKFHNTSPEIRSRILTCISKQTGTIYYRIIQKPDRNFNQDELKGRLLNDLIEEIITDFPESADIYMDKFLKQPKQETFTRTWICALRDCDKITYIDSVRCPGIQIADFFAGALLFTKNNPETEESHQYEKILKIL